MTNKEKFRAALLKEFQADPIISRLEKTPEEWAEMFTSGALDGSAMVDGPRIVRACRALGIKRTRKAIREYCAAD